MSSCVICLVIAREIFLLLSDCSVITKVHNVSLSSLLYKILHVIKLFCKGWTNAKNGGHFIQIGYFFSTWMSVLMADFSANRLYYWFAKHLHRFCCWFEWLEAQFQNNTMLESLSLLPSIFGYLVLTHTKRAALLRRCRMTSRSATKEL